MLPTVAILSTGGTIASTSAEGGATPSKRGADLVEAVPELETHADLAVEEIAQVPSYDMTFDTMMDLATAVRRVAADGADGVVVTHGTDTLEESAYFLDLTLECTIPVVFTGAQRRPDETSPDGPANLLAAVRVASHEQFSSGVYVATNDEVHAARDVTKTHTSALETFDSPSTGPIAALTRSDVRVIREPRSYSATFDVGSVTSDIAIVASGADMGRRPIDRALEDDVDGIVVNGTGLGNTTSDLGGAIAAAVAAETPVVVVSRCQAGVTAPVYGGGGGGTTLQSHGAIHGDDLPAHKARVKLAVVCAVADAFEERRRLFTGE
ncbi:asparaginase [Natronorubrum sulfidifaciens]|uniref:L-asparaginase n=1 Tax=Natronorubrum sulfidifaciens JCM 14089 TaxID=1230460 RepID=L9VUU3_9EURY|nr:asparaginase [Natronorubrum sulfidifaciens]ELY40950.1 asparaginase [Natronorubrum sulfidifaciens JCM 14089]